MKNLCCTVIMKILLTAGAVTLGMSKSRWSCIWRTSRERMSDFSIHWFLGFVSIFFLYSAFRVKILLCWIFGLEMQKKGNSFQAHKNFLFTKEQQTESEGRPVLHSNRLEVMLWMFVHIHKRMRTETWGFSLTFNMKCILVVFVWVN